ncbi:MAG: hypothetical protein ABI433_10990 [Burkholderiaceae bacterium]
MDLRTAMPTVARLVDERRQRDGAEFVNGCIKRAMAGEPNQFYAFEGGHVLGTPFKPDFDVVLDHCVRMSIAWGGKYAMVMRNPEPTGG